MQLYECPMVISSMYGYIIPLKFSTIGVKQIEHLCFGERQFSTIFWCWEKCSTNDWCKTKYSTKMKWIVLIYVDIYSWQRQQTNVQLKKLTMFTLKTEHLITSPYNYLYMYKLKYNCCLSIMFETIAPSTVYNWRDHQNMVWLELWSSDN